MLGLGGLLILVVVWTGLYLIGKWLYDRGRMHHDWHRDALSVAVLVVVLLGFYWPLFFTESWIPKGGGDLASFIYPTYAFAARWLRRGIIPLWNPHLYMGMPFAADNQSGLFYPINLLVFMAVPDLTYEAVELMAVGHVFLAGLFTYMLLRDVPAIRATGGKKDAVRPLGRVPAVAGAVVYMLSDLFVIHPGNLNIIATAAWLPLVFLCFRRAVQRKSWGWAAWAGVTLGIAALVGHAQMLLYIGMSLGLYTVYVVYDRWTEGWQSALGRAGLLCLTAGLAFGLAAIALIPAFDMTHYTVRASMSYEEASNYSMPLAGLIGTVLPGFFGRGTGTFWAPWPRTEMGYVGVLPLLLAAVAVLFSFRCSLLTRFCAFLGLFGLLVAFGPHTVLHGWLYALVPVFRQLRVPARAIVLFGFSIAVLAGQGLDILLHPWSRRVRQGMTQLGRVLRWTCGALAFVAVPILGHAVLTSRMSVPPDVLQQLVTSMGSVIYFVAVLAFGLVGLEMRTRGTIRRPVLGVLAVLVIGFDLISQGAYVEIEPNDPLVGFRHNKTLSFLADDRTVYRVETATEAQGGWSPDWALIHEWDDYSGIWNPLRLGAYDVLSWVGIRREDPFYNLYNVKYLLAGQQTPVPAHFERVYDAQGDLVYENKHVLPRAFMVYEVRLAKGDLDALGIARSPDFQPDREIVLKHSSGAQALGTLDVEPVSHVEFGARNPNRIEYVVETTAAGYLFISEMWMPGWEALVDGNRERVYQANYTFRAVRVPEGRHEIVLRYRPTSWRIGWMTTCGTLVGLVLVGVWAGLRRRRGRSTQPGTLSS